MFVSGRPTDPKFIDQPKLLYNNCHFQVHIFIVQINNGSQLNECIDVAINTIIQLLALFKRILYSNLLGFNNNSLLNPFIKASRTLLLFY